MLRRMKAVCLAGQMPPKASPAWPPAARGRQTCPSLVRWEPLSALLVQNTAPSFPNHGFIPSREKGTSAVCAATLLAAANSYWPSALPRCRRSRAAWPAA